MKNKRIFLTLLVVLVVGLLLVSIGCGAAKVNPTPDKPLDVSLAQNNPPPAVFVWGVTEPWAKEVEEKTNGLMKFTHYNAEALGPAKENWNMTVSGLADVGFQFASYVPGSFYLCQAVEIPGSGITTATVENQVLMELYRTNKYFQEEFKAAKVLFFTGCPTRVLHTTKPVQTLEDLKGMKIATLGRWDARAIELLGGTPVNILVPDQYMALEKGIVDGTLLLNEGILAFKLNDIVKHSTHNIELNMISGWVAMNWDFWNSLPDNLQKDVQEVSDTWSKKAGEQLDKTETECSGALAGMGTTVYDLTEAEKARWNQKLEPMLGEWITMINEQGKPGQEIMDEIGKLSKKY